MGGLVVYVTSHGFGHLNRSVAVINKMPLCVPVTIRCDPNMFAHWHERLTRHATLEPHISDAGAVNPPGDSASTDGHATLKRAARVHAEALEIVDSEAERLRSEKTAAVLCDAPPLPLVASKRAGIPSFLLANFTWAEIYAPHARKLGGDSPRLVREIRSAYRQATALFRAEPSLKMSGFAREIEVGMVVTPGRDRSEEIRQTFGLRPTDRLVYSYFGRYGQADMGWARLAKLAARGIHFVGFHPPPNEVGALPNLHVVDPARWIGADLAASTDVIVAKAGYGTVCEAMVAGTPMIYPPRSGFVEHRMLDRTLRTWGGGLPVSARAFGEFRFERVLERAFDLKPGPPPFRADGASIIAEHLTQICQS